MAIAFTALTGGTQDSGGNVTTESVNPSGIPVLVFTASGSTARPAVSGLGLTWILVQETTDAVANRYFGVFHGVGTPTPGAVTVQDPGTWSRSVWQIVDMEGATGVVVQSKARDESGSVGPILSIAFDASMGAGNGALAAFANWGGAYTSTPRSGWTELADRTIPTRCALAVHARSDGDTEASANYGSTTASQRYAILIEFEAEGASSGLEPIADLSAQAGDGSVTLSWTPPTGATSQQLHRALYSPVPEDGSAALGVPLSGTADQTTDITAVNGVTYYYKVSATDGVSAVWSNEVSATPQDALSATSPGGSLDVGVVTLSQAIMGTVTLSLEPVEGARLYLIDQDTSTVVATQTTGADGKYQFSNVAPGTYHVVVEAEGYAAPSRPFIVIE